MGSPSGPDYSSVDDLCGLVALPSEMPQLDRYSPECTFIVDLHREVLTMNHLDHMVHWKLGPGASAWRLARRGAP
jgi:hypothetical protein